MTTAHMSPAEARRAMAKHAGTQSETIIKKQVKAYLQLRGWFIFYNLQGVGAYKGVPDFIAVKEGRVVFLEVKTATGRLSNWQLIFQAHIEDGGGEYVVVRSLEDAMDVDRQKEEL